MTAHIHNPAAVIWFAVVIVGCVVLYARKRRGERR